MLSLFSDIECVECSKKKLITIVVLVCVISRMCSQCFSSTLNFFSYMCHYLAFLALWSFSFFSGKKIIYIYIYMYYVLYRNWNCKQAVLKSCYICYTMGTFNLICWFLSLRLIVTLVSTFESVIPCFHKESTMSTVWYHSNYCLLLTVLLTVGPPHCQRTVIVGGWQDLSPKWPVMF